ncbi:hypothetical protein 10S11_43 [uncultured Caudovirales phage]|uniref:Uncharacterized protein n=1 Tax=uncultured Caudovirales phage TaxID=2100421 RepID=A0A2H4J070_9CAUD|nr:hypothetical protein 10S11_43 [uncultured Caudovirales phage]
MQGRIKVLKDVDKSNILPMTHAKAVYVDEKNTLDKTLNNIESYMEQQRKTYAELKELVDNKELIPGVQYVLTDYRTKYIQPTTNVLKEMGIEELVLTANSESTFEPIVSSLKYPEDVVYYDFNNNACEDKATPRKGFILRRYDPISKNDAPQDWRTMLWARYKPDKSSYYEDGSKRNYALYSSGQPAIMKHVYKAENKLWMARSTNVPTSATDPNVFTEVYPSLDVPLLTSEKTKIGKGIELIRGDLIEVKTFGEGCFGNTIRSIGTENINLEVLHNNVFINNSYRNKVFGTSNTFGISCFHNILDNYAFGNVFFSESRYNTFGVYCFSNVIGIKCDNNVFNTSCSSNILNYGNLRTFLGNNCSSNILSVGSSANTFGSGCFENVLGINCSDNSFGTSCFRNEFGNGCNNNSFGNSCYNNSFGNGCLRNTFRNYNCNNIFGNNCVNNSFGNDNEKNNFGDNCSNNTFFNNCDDNTFVNNFQWNVVKQLSNKKTVAGALTDNRTTTIQVNSGGAYIYWYISTSDSLVVIAIP